MPGLTVKVVLEDIKKFETEALIVGFHEDVRPLRNLAGELDWLLCGSLSDLIIRRKLRGAAGDVGLLTSRGKVPAQKIFMIGLGRSGALTALALKSGARTALSSAINTGVKKTAIELFPASKMSFDASVSALLSGMSEGAGTAQIEVAILAPDPLSYERVSRLVQG